MIRRASISLLVLISLVAVVSTLSAHAFHPRKHDPNERHSHESFSVLAFQLFSVYSDSAPEGWDVQFEYDTEGRRFKKHVTRYKDGAAVEQKVITFVWDGWDLLYERHEDIHGNFLLDRKYIWGPDIADGAAGGAGGLLLIREKRGQTTSDYYPIYDGTGHVTGITDSTGKLVAEYWYGPFGELIEAKGEMAHLNPWRYATKYFDAETGLYYFGLRYYDPATGQWMNREPLGEDESLNLYIYGNNDPINKVDRLGLEAINIEADVTALNNQYAGLIALITRAGSLAINGQATDLHYEALVDEFQTAYASYLKGVSRLQRNVIANEVSGHNMWSRYWHADEFASNAKVAFRLPIIPENDGIASLLPSEQLISALNQSRMLSGIRSSTYGMDGETAAVIQGELETLQTRVNYISAATGVGGVVRGVIVAGSAKAGALYLAKTSGGFALGFIGSAGAQYTVDVAQEKGLITQDQAVLTQTGIAVFQLILAKRAMNRLPKGTAGLETRGFRPPTGTRQIPEGIPAGWRIRPTKGEGGTWYYDPTNKGNSVRVMPGDPASPFPNSQSPYVRWQSNGSPLDVNGNPLPTKFSPDAHIPLQDYIFNPALFR